MRGVHQGIDDFAMPDPAQVRAATDLLRMLSDPTRFSVLWALAQGESNVACLAELAGTSPTAVSQHLSKLRLAGLVQGRREGTFVYYTVAEGPLGTLLVQALRAVGADPAAHTAARRH